MFRKQDSTRIITSDRAATFLDKGWKKADLHVHTSCSYDVPSSKTTHPENLLEKARSMGLDFVTFTDHDTACAYDLLGWKRDGLTTGVELSITDLENVGHTVHINAFEFDREQYLEMESIAHKDKDIYSLLDYLKANDLPHTYNHPFWFKPGERPNLFAVPELARHFPVIEYNMQDLRQKNFFSMALARRFQKGMAVTTDSHTGGIARVYTLAPGDDFREYFNNIKKGRSYMVMDEPVWKHITMELNAWIELVFNMEQAPDKPAQYSTGVQKFDRVVDLMIGKDKLGKYPKLTNMAMNLIQHVSDSGVPVFLYMLSKQPQVSRINRIISGI